MNLAFAVFFLWMGAGALYFASHGVEAVTPWEGFMTILGRIREA